MNYNPRPGDFGVVKTNGIIGRLIRVGTASRWNHAFIYVGDGTIVEANPTGVAISPVTKYPHIAWNQHDQLTDETREKIVDIAFKEVGKPYAFLDIASLFFRIIGLRFIKPNVFWKRLSQQESWFCSELVAYCYRISGLTLINKKDDLVTPGDLAERLVYQ
jgi:uncharacterized protein YycO